MYLYTVLPPDMTEPAYAELHCISNYSFLRGASHPEELVLRASELGYSAIAVTDECSMAGVVKAHMAAIECGIKLIVGSEFRLENSVVDCPGKPVHIVLLAPTRVAYGQICNLITIGRRRGEKGEYDLSLKDLEIGLSECLAIWLPDDAKARSPHAYRPHTTSSGNQEHPYARHLKTGTHLAHYFSGRLWLGIEAFPDGREMARYEQGFTLARILEVPLVACGDVHMHDPSRKPLQDVLSAVRMGQSVRLAGRLLGANREKHLRPLETLGHWYPPDMLAETVRIAGRCQFSLAELRYEYPEELVPAHLSPGQYLRQLTYAGAARRWPDGINPGVQATIEHELRLIGELSYEYYFLTVFDIVHFARSQGILCQGRGSAANSAVCYCLEITEVDPARVSLLFERFISKERNEPPDIDVDFEHERREEVIQYIYKKYGRHRAAIAATVITYRPKSAIRDVGKALGLDLQLVDHLAKSLSWWDRKDQLLERFAENGVNPDSPVIGQFVAMVKSILGFPRHLSQHVGGFIISSGPLSHLVPVENAAMPDRTIIQWDKYDIEALGLLKIDVLALGMLTAIRKSFDLFYQYRGTSITISDIPPEDPLTYQMLQKGDSVGVFQVESRAQMSMLPRLKPKTFYDLVIEVAIVRPGPIQGNMVHPYLKRRAGLEPVTYANDAVRGVLERTLGVPIFQEQVIKLAVVAAGFSPGEADQLRRAMAAWKRKGGLEAFEEKLVNGMLERGHPREFAERIFEQIKGFGDYGFPESHAASFALLVYISAWIKCYEPAAFYCGLLNSQPMGFYSPSQLVQDARRHDIKIRPVDALASDWESTLEQPGYARGQITAPQPAIRLGLQRIKGLRENTAIRIIHARHRRQFADIGDLSRRARLDRGELGRLTEGGALKTLVGHRYQTHWEARGILPPTALNIEETEIEETEIEAATVNNTNINNITPGVPGTAINTQPADSAAGINHAPANAYTKVAERPAHYQQPSQAGSLHQQTKPGAQDRVMLPAPGENDDLRADYASLGLTLGRHPMAILRESGGPFRNCRKANELETLRHGCFIQVAGVVTGRQRPGSASGVLFLTLEDETHNINVVVWTRVLEQYRKAIVQGRLLKVKGIMERQASVIHVIAGHVEDLSDHLDHFALQSRDFR